MAVTRERSLIEQTETRRHWSLQELQQLLAETIKDRTIHGQEHRLRLQDAIGRMSYDEVQQLEAGLGVEERRTLVWIIFSVMSQDTAVDLLKATVLKRLVDQTNADLEQAAVERFAEVNAAAAKLESERQAFEAGKRAIYRHLGDQRRTIERQQQSLKSAAHRESNLHARLSELRQQLEALEPLAQLRQTLRQLIA